MVGFAAGLVLRAQLQGTPDRAEAAASMFEHWCIARLRGENPVPGAPLEYFSGWPGYAVWIDPDSLVALDLSASRCMVSDEIAPMTALEQVALSQIVMTKMELWAPELTEDPSLGLLLPGTLAWTSQHSLDDPLRWGIILTSEEEEGQGSYTSLSIALPADPKQ